MKINEYDFKFLNYSKSNTNSKTGTPKQTFQITFDDSRFYLSWRMLNFSPRWNHPIPDPKVERSYPSALSIGRKRIKIRQFFNDEGQPPNSQRAFSSQTRCSDRIYNARIYDMRGNECSRIPTHRNPIFRYVNSRLLLSLKEKSRKGCTQFFKLRSLLSNVHSR